MSFGDIPIRENGKDFLVEAAWFNTIRTELIAAFGSGGYITVQATQIIGAGGTITVDPVAFKPLIPIKSDGGTVEISLTPFGTSHGFLAGKEIILLGLSDVDVVIIKNNVPDNVDEGMVSNGKIVLTKYSQIILIYSESLKRFIRKE